MQEKRIHTITFTKGMVLDVDKSQQLPGTYSYALNAVDVSDEGNEGNLMNEKGFTKYVDLQENCYLLGHCNLDDSTVIVFTLTDTGNSRIGKVDLNGVYSSVFINNNLNFKVTNQIRAVFKTARNGDILVYFTDNINPVRVINIDSPAGTVAELSLFSEYNIPRFVKAEIGYGRGKLLAGSYIYGFRYVDGSGNKSSFLALTNPVPVHNENIGQYIDGSVEAETINSLIITMSNIDTDYESIEVGVLFPDFTAKIIKDISITSSTVTFEHTGLEADALDVSITEFAVPQVAWEYAKEINQASNRLLLGNIKSLSSYNFQPYANNIVTDYYGRRFDYPVDTDSTGELRYYTSIYANATDVVLHKSLLRDEVYAFGISLVFKNGTESSVFHIPGRAIETNTTDNYLGLNLDAFSRYKGPWDTVTVGQGDPNNFLHTSSPRWKIENTAYRKGTFSQISMADGSTITHYGKMGYWESTETYPNNTSWGGNGVSTEDLRNKQIRHHRVPDCLLEPVKNNADNKHFIILPRFTNIQIPADLKDFVQGVKFHIGKITDSENFSVIR